MITWMEKHMVVTVLIVLWLLALFSAVTLKVFLAPANIPAGTVSAYGIFFGVPALAIGLWQFRTRIIDSRRGVNHASVPEIDTVRQGAPLGPGGAGFPRWPGRIGGAGNDAFGVPDWRLEGDGGMYDGYAGGGYRGPGASSRFEPKNPGGGL